VYLPYEERLKYARNNHRRQKLAKLIKLIKTKELAGRISIGTSCAFSYTPSMHRITSQEFRQLCISYIANIFLYSCALYIFHTNNYYTHFLTAQTKEALVTMFGIYIVLALPLELLLPGSRRRLESKGLIALRAFARYMREGWQYLSRFPLQRTNSPGMTRQEKTAILFLIVKFYFLPIMINFSFGNWLNVQYYWGQIGTFADTSLRLLDGVFPFLMALFLLIDTCYFIFGYSVEYPAARNEVRSVEPTLFGWLIALACYPPLNGITDKYFIWTADNSAHLPTVEATYVMSILALIFLFIYLWATLALGPRCSNLTNRGIVSWGPYAYVRHPAYIGKILGWWITSIPFFVGSGRLWEGMVALLGWTTIYFFRALTEERHLMADPAYMAYCKQVRWRFIPGVF